MACVGLNYLTAVSTLLPKQKYAKKNAFITPVTMPIRAQLTG